MGILSRIPMRNTVARFVDPAGLILPYRRLVCA